MRLMRMLAPVALALAMLAGLMGTTAAQDAPGATPEDGIPDGLQQWYARSFNADLEALFATPTDEMVPAGWVVLSANVISFETADQATAAMDDLLAQLDAETGGEQVQVEEIELASTVDTIAKVATEEVEGSATQVIQAVGQDETYVYLVIGLVVDTDPAGLAAQVFDEMAAAEAGEGEGTFDPTGGSEGGLWDKLPSAAAVQAEAPVLTVVEDAIFYPEMPLEAEATPAP